MLNVAHFLQCVPFEYVKDTHIIIKVSSGWKLKIFKFWLFYISLEVVGMIFQILPKWSFISLVTKIESVFFICVISFGVMLQLTLFNQRHLFVKLIREMAKFENKYNRKLT